MLKYYHLSTQKLDIYKLNITSKDVPYRRKKREKIRQTENLETHTHAKHKNSKAFL